MCLANTSKDFTVYSMKDFILCGYVHNFSVDYDSIDGGDTVDIRKYLMRKHDMK